MQPVERSNPEGVDFGWVMQVTFVVTIAVGAPIVAALSSTVALPTWGERVGFAVRVGAVVWFLTALAAYAYARRAGDSGDGSDVEARAGCDPGSPEDPSGTPRPGESRPRSDDGSESAPRETADADLDAPSAAEADSRPDAGPVDGSGDA